MGKQRFSFDGKNVDIERFVKESLDGLLEGINKELEENQKIADAVVARCCAGLDGPELCDAMPRIIREFASERNMSLGLAKRMLKAAGYKQAAGALVEVDGCVLPPHAWSAKLKDNETYTIPVLKATQLSMEDEKFRETTQFYLYIDGHFVLDDPRYVARDASGCARMTDYARYHVDECCLLFRFFPEQEEVEVLCDQQPGDFEDWDGIPPYKLRFELAGEELLDAGEKLRRMVTIHEQEDALLAKLAAIASETRTDDAPNSGKEWGYLIDLQKTNQTKLAEDTRINRWKINRIVNLKEEPDLDTAFLMCMGLSLTPRISFYMLERSMLHLFPRENSKHFFLYAALLFRYDKPVEETRAELLSVGVVL